MNDPRLATTAPGPNDIIKGKVISTAKIQCADRVRIVAVFDTSIYQFFYFVFEAKNMRTPRNRWIYTKQYNQIYGDASQGGTGGFYTLESYAAMLSRRYQGTKTVIKRIIKSADLRAQIENTIHPAQAQPRPGDTFGVASRITAGKQSKITRSDRAGAWSSWNNQHKQG